MNASIRVALVLAAISACEGDVDTEAPVEIRDAREGWNAANHALAPAYEQFVTSVQVEQFGEIELECTDGGSLLLVGRMSEQRDFQLDAMFDECDETGVVLDGNLTLTSNLELFFDDGSHDHDDIHALVIVDYHGLLHLDGEAAGSCTIATQVHATGLVFAGFASDSVVVDGAVCGLDANAVVHAPSA